MIKDIEIQNFRCFEHTKIEGFERVNLIGGKNNAGKTALLEALIVTENVDNILYLKDLRKQSSRIVKSLPDQTIKNLYFTQNINRQIILKFQWESGYTKENEIDFYNNFFDLPEEFLKREQYLPFVSELNQIIFDQDENLSPVLKIDIFQGNPTISDHVGHLSYLLLIGLKDYKKIEWDRPFIRSLAIETEKAHSMPIIPSFVNRTSSEVAQDYERLILDEKESEVLQAFQTLDPFIKKVESFSIGSPSLYITRQGEKRLPIALFGDAINRIAQIVIKLIRQESSILLIDEIENGIHYTNQREFWKMLFRLAKDLNKQIFATTHSIEMIRAFADVGLEDYPDQGAYFELFRSPRTDKIMGVKRDLRTLDYALKHDKEVRGE